MGDKNRIEDSEELLSEEILDDKSKNAQEQQQQLYELFGFENNVIWDCYERHDKEALERKIRLILKSDENQHKKIEENILKIIDAIWKQRKYNGGTLLMSPIFILSVDYDSYKGKIRDAQYSRKYNMHPVFRIRKCVKKDDSHNCCMIFIDESSRVYATWDDFLNNNTLPKAIIVAPKRGIYMAGQLGHVLLDIQETPVCSVGSKVVQTADVGTTVASIGSTTILVAGILSAPVAAPVMAGAAMVGIACGAYSLVRSSYSLIDRFKHEQSIGLKDADARGNWIGVAGGITGMAAGGVSRGLAYMARNGTNVGIALRSTINVINATAIATNGAGVVNGFIGVYLRYQDDGSVSTLDVVQLGASLFLFTHSIYNFQTASRIIRSNQESTISRFREDLSRNQKRMFDKMSKETVRIRGGDVGRSDIIRSLKNIPDQKSFFRDVYKINQELNRNNVKISFGTDGRAVLNNADFVRPAELRAQLKISSPAGIFANVPPTPEGNLVAVNSELNLNSGSPSIDPHTLHRMIGLLGATFHIFSEDELETSIVNLLENLSIQAFNIFMDIVKSFVSEYGDYVQGILRRVIPFEVFMSDSFKVIASLAGENDINQYIEHTIEDIRPVICIAIKEFYDQFRPNHDREIKCKLCGGIFYDATD